ncbi:MAG: biopolymer transporter ExbD, partial [Elusimicrobia bacterium]|nr:biopolymer transporter ExbD [Elusimicrobiota bacterium]
PLRKGLVAEINMIPLIDVALILLIIFMVITPFLVQSQIAVRLPKSNQGSSTPQSSIIQIQIGQDGSVSIEGRRVVWENLERELTLKLSRAAQKSVLVQADRTVPIEKVVFVLDVAKKLGVGKLGIGVAPSAS